MQTPYMPPAVLTFDINYQPMYRPVLEVMDPNLNIDTFPLHVVGMPDYLQAIFNQTHKGYPMALLSTIEEAEKVTAAMNELGLPYRTKILPPVNTKTMQKPAAFRVVYLGVTVT